jgi:hypothetical protein
MASKAVTEGWLADSGLSRYRPLLIAVQCALLFIGVVFWIDAMNGGGGFKESTWGWLAYALPSKAWAFLNMATAAITINGLIKPISRWMVAVGALLHCAQFVVLSYSAIMCGGVFVIGLYASVLFLPLHMWMLFEALKRG